MLVDIPTISRVILTTFRPHLLADDPPPQLSTPHPLFPSTRESPESPDWLCQLLSCSPQAYQSCTCLSSRSKSEAGVRDRGINSLIDGDTYTSAARSWRDASLRAAQAQISRKDAVAAVAPEEEESSPVICGIDVRLAHQSPVKSAEEHAPLINYHAGDVLK